MAITRERLLFLSLFLWLFCCPPQASKAQIPVVYTYPDRDAEGVSSKTTIGVRYAEQLDISALDQNAFIVSGTLSGIHSGTIKPALDRRTVIFTPDNFFLPGEIVEVACNPLSSVSGKKTLPYSFKFRISKSQVLHKALPERPSRSSFFPSATPKNPLWINSTSADTLPNDFPAIHVTINNNPAPGNIYLADLKNDHNDTGSFLIELDNAGNLLFERRSWPSYSTDFKPQPNGLFTYFDTDLGTDGTDFRYKFYGMDSNFVVVDSFEAANAYLTDDHELIFLPGGGYALFAEIDEEVDMRKYVSGGDSNTTVVSTMLQEFDSAKNLILQWDSRKYFLYSDVTNQDFSTTFLDFTHCNSIENDGDTAFIISSRNLDEVTKISREDGHIIWRLGGKNNQFTFINDTIGFSRQHAVRKLKNGNITMFDNGDFHTPQVSRAVEYHLDEQAKTATKVWEYHHNPDVYSYIMGYVQQLDNGNRLIGWGGCDSVAVTEIKPDGSTALEIKFDPGFYSYRALKYPKDYFKSSVSPDLPDPTFTLAQNYPNPFASSSTINFKTGRRTPLKLIVYDALGRQISTLFNGTVEAGSYSAICTSGNLPSGAYFYTLSSPTTSSTRIMFISK